MLNDLYLDEMGIQRWELTHPERLTGYQAKALILPMTCKLLFISPTKPVGQVVLMFERVLKSIHLSLDDVLFLTPQQALEVGEHQLEWVWLATNIEHSFLDLSRFNIRKQLQTPLLQDIDGNNQQRRLLWQQICSYH